MAFVYSNPNPLRERVGDCTVRAISLAMEEAPNESIRQQLRSMIQTM